MSELNLLDSVIMIIVLIGMWRGFKVGFIQSIVSLIGWLIAFFAGSRFADDIAPYFTNIVESPVLQTALGFLTIVLVMITLIHMVASVLKKILASLQLSFLDKISGGVLGAFRSVLVILVVISMSAPMLVKLPIWQASVLIPELLPYAPVAKKMIHELVGETWSYLDEDKSAIKMKSDNTN